MLYCILYHINMDNTYNMRIEKNRLLTFDKVWTNEFVTARSLAKNGFYYVDNEDGETDSVKCAYCNVVIHDWVEGNNPEIEHNKYSAKCYFVKNGNIDIAVYDECGTGKSNPTIKYNPVHSKYKTEQSRIDSFKNWPISMSQKPEELADAGLFYLGIGDYTKCFYCDGGLKDWKADDVPWEEHARWFDRCEYVKILKGKEFIQRAMTQACVVKSNEKEEKPSEKEIEKEIDDSKVCKICYSEEYNVCISPCGHVFCAKCSLNTNSICVICQQKYESIIRLRYP